MEYNEQDDGKKSNKKNIKNVKEEEEEEEEEIVKDGKLMNHHQHQCGWYPRLLRLAPTVNLVQSPVSLDFDSIQ